MVDVIVKITIKEVRRKNGISIRKLSEMTGISKTYLSDLENNHYNPSIYILCLIAVHLGVPTRALYTYKIIHKN